MKKILTIILAVLIIGFIFYGVQSVVKRFNLARSDEVVKEQVSGVSDEITENTEALNHLNTETQVDDNQQIHGDVALVIEESKVELEAEESVAVEDSDQEIKIRIIKEPLGEEPDWVKRVWVGLEIPVIKGSYSQKGGQEVLSGDFRAADNYATYVNEALAILKAKNPDAEKWWRDNVDLVGVDYIAFDKTVCKLIGVDD